MIDRHKTAQEASQKDVQDDGKNRRLEKWIIPDQVPQLVNREGELCSAHCNLARGLWLSGLQGFIECPMNDRDESAMKVLSMLQGMDSTIYTSRGTAHAWHAARGPSHKLFELPVAGHKIPRASNTGRPWLGNSLLINLNLGSFEQS